MFDVGNDFPANQVMCYSGFGYAERQILFSRREIDSRRQWGYGTCYGDSFPTAKECTFTHTLLCQIVMAKQMTDLKLNYQIDNI